MYSNEIISLTEEQKALVPADQMGIIEMSDEDMENVAGGFCFKLCFGDIIINGPGDVNFFPQASCKWDNDPGCGC